MHGKPAVARYHAHGIPAPLAVRCSRSSGHNFILDLRLQLRGLQKRSAGPYCNDAIENEGIGDSGWAEVDKTAARYSLWQDARPLFASRQAWRALFSKSG
jgi:hypothetical protein